MYWIEDAFWLLAVISEQQVLVSKGFFHSFVRIGLKDNDNNI